MEGKGCGPMPNSQTLWPGWETVRMIGRGSFGAVYEINRQIFDDTEKAALKVISIPQNPDDIDEMYSDGYDEESITSTFQSHLKSIVAEYSLMRKLNGNANIVHCDDVKYVKHDDGIGWDIFIKMELLTSLSKSLSGVISEDTVVKVAIDMCKALELCCKQGIIHRDIKPQNIFVSENGDYKLGDFGIAKTVEKTMGGTKIGTPKYMAPEVYNNQPYGTSADIYSLGLVLYWMLNEKRMPFVPMPPAKLLADMEEEARNRRFSGESIPAPKNGSKVLQQIVLKACAYDPEERYPSAGAMLDDLNRLTAASSVGSRDHSDIAERKFSLPLESVDELATLGSDPERKEKQPPPAKKNLDKRPIAAVALACIGLLALILTLGFGGKDANNSDASAFPGVMEFNGHYYYIFDMPLENYEEAAAFCKNLGGHMADVNSEEENQFLYDYLCSMGYDYVFLGGNDIREDGIWEWESGEPFAYQNWNEGEPNNDLGGEDHLAMYRVLADGSWNDLTFAAPSYQAGTAQIGNLEASSYCTDSRKNCLVEYLVDGNPVTAWCTSDSDKGIGESALFEFEKMERLFGFTIHSGNQFDEQSFVCSRRPRTIRLVFGNGFAQTFELEDRVGEQFILFDSVVVTDSVKMVIDSAYGYDESEGIAVSEILFHTENRKTGFVCEWQDEKSAKSGASLYEAFMKVK